MEWQVFLEWGSKAVLGGVALHGVKVLGDMKSSIDELNNKMARIIERSEWHSREIDRLETRISRLEVSKANG